MDGCNVDIHFPGPQYRQQLLVAIVSRVLPRTAQGRRVGGGGGGRGGEGNTVGVVGVYVSEGDIVQIGLQSLLSPSGHCY